MHVPHTRQLGWPFGKAIAARRPSNVVRAVMTGSSPTPSASRAGSDEEAEAVRHDLDRDAGRLGAPDERHEARIVRLGRGRRQQVAAGSASTMRHLAAPSAGASP